MKTIYRKYAELLVDYCLEIQPGEKLYVKSSTLAVPLVKEVYRVALNRGAVVEIDLDFSGKHKIYMEEAKAEQLTCLPVLQEKAMSGFDAYLNIRAPFNLKEDQNIDADKRKIRSRATKSLMESYFRRTADGSLKRSLCQFPTHANAQEAGMSLEEYEQFVFNACNLYADDPAAEWLKMRHKQQRIVDYLNKKQLIRYKSDVTDISFSVAGRTWINSDGRTNMPSGEVFSGPVEQSVNGHVHFDYPAIFMGKEVKGITLQVKDGKVDSWDAVQGKDVLDRVFAMDGARYFGEVAIGTNYNIQRATKNILFDEKIGGTIHMAVGQSYAQTGGKNKSSIHWDMISNMKNGGQIFADGELMYENGLFLI